MPRSGRDGSLPSGREARGRIVEVVTNGAGGRRWRTVGSRLTAGVNDWADHRGVEEKLNGARRQLRKGLDMKVVGVLAPLAAPCDKRLVGTAALD